MKLNVYEVFDLFEKSPTLEQKKQVLKKNANQTLLNLLVIAFTPAYQFYRVDAPKGYKQDDCPPGMAISQLSAWMDKMYVFYKQNPLSERKKDEQLLNLLESLEAREAQVVLNLFNKDLKVKGLDEDLIRETFPGLLG